MLNFDFLKKGLEIITPSHFVYMIFQKKNVSCYALLTDQMPFPDYYCFFGQYVYCNCWLTRL